MRWLAALLLLSGCVTYDRARVEVDGMQCVEPVPAIVVGQEISISASGQVVVPSVPSELQAQFKASPHIVRLYTLGQSLLFLQSALFQLCIDAANGTITPDDHAKLVRKVLGDASQLLWLEGGGPFEE